MASAWLRSARFDLSLIVGVALLAGGMSAITVWRPDYFLAVLTFHTWLFGYEHLWATYSNLVVHPQDRKNYRRLIWLAPPLVFCALYAAGFRYGMQGLLLVYFCGQFFHTVRQSWGILQQYRLRAGGLQWDNPRLSELTLWSIPLWGFLSRCAERPDEFIFQDFWLPPVPRGVVLAAACVSVALWCYWIFTRIVAFRRGQLVMGHTLYMASHATIFLFAYILIPDLCAGWLLVNVWHNVQYMLFVWLYNRRRYASGVDHNARTLSWLSQGGFTRVLLYIATTIALALPVYYLLPLLGASLDSALKNTAVPFAIVIGFTLTFHHYWADAIIWKRRHNPQMQVLDNAAIT